MASKKIKAWVWKKQTVAITARRGEGGQTRGQLGYSTERREFEEKDQCLSTSFALIACSKGWPSGKKRYLNRGEKMGKPWGPVYKPRNARHWTTNGGMGRLRRKYP